MKILIVDEMHFKNKIGILLLLEHLKIEYKICQYNDVNKYIKDYDIIHSQYTPIDASLFPGKKFILVLRFPFFLIINY